MKTFTAKFTLALSLFFSLFFAKKMFAQAPQKISYQAVVRNATGEPVVNQNVAIKINISETTPAGNTVYEETHAVTTNAFGLANLAVGAGTVITGNIATINWGVDEYFLNIAVDVSGGSNFVALGSSQLLSVPYALYAEKANSVDGLPTTFDTDSTNELQTISYNSTTGELTISNGNTIILPSGFSGDYNDLTNAPTNLSEFTNDAGFITSPNDADSDPTNELQAIFLNGNNLELSQNGGSVDLSSYLDNTDAQTLTLAGNDLSISNGNTVDVSPILDNTWKIDGNSGTDPAVNFIGTTDNKDLVFKVNNTAAGKITATNDDVFLGVNSGISGTTGFRNTAIGSDALRNNTTGNRNTAVGNQSLQNNTTGIQNTAIGRGTILNNTTGNNNTAIGFDALVNNTIGSDNLAIGRLSLDQNRAGSSAVAIGTEAMRFANNTTTAYDNTNIAVGFQALRGSTAPANNTGLRNIAIGYQSLLSNSTGSTNVALGSFSLRNNTTGSGNTAVGDDALSRSTTGTRNVALGKNALYLTTSGNFNTAIGQTSLFNNTIGNDNTAVGSDALKENITGSKATAVGARAMLFSNNSTTAFDNLNIAVGYEALRGSTNPSANTGNRNIAMGFQSLALNSEGSFNVAVGSFTLLFNTTGNDNTAIGDDAVNRNTTGNSNTGIGREALYFNTTGSLNTAVGTRALYNNAIGSRNVAVGHLALANNTSSEGNVAMGTFAARNTTGDSNTAIGDDALNANTTGIQNTALGRGALYFNTTGNGNTALGGFAYFNGNFSNSTALGAGSAISASNQVRIGNSNVTSIGGFQNWSNVSDARLKKNVKEDVKGLDFILKLRPVTYHLNTSGTIFDNGNKINTEYSTPILHTGFIAQEVEAAAKSVGYNFSGVDLPKNETDYYGLRYAEFTVPLVKAVQEQQAIIEQQNKLIQSLSDRISALEQQK